MNYFGNRLKILRLKHNLSQLQLARELHVSQSTISSWENGLSEPNIFKLVSVARFFKVSVDYLIGLKD